MRPCSAAGAWTGVAIAAVRGARTAVREVRFVLYGDAAVRAFGRALAGAGG